MEVGFLSFEFGHNTLNLNNFVLQFGSPSPQYSIQINMVSILNGIKIALIQILRYNLGILSVIIWETLPEAQRTQKFSP